MQCFNGTEGQTLIQNAYQIVHAKFPVCTCMRASMCYACALHAGGTYDVCMGCTCACMQHEGERLPHTFVNDKDVAASFDALSKAICAAGYVASTTCFFSWPANAGLVPLAHWLGWLVPSFGVSAWLQGRFDG